MDTPVYSYNTPNDYLVETILSMVKDEEWLRHQPRDRNITIFVNSGDHSAMFAATQTTPSLSADDYHQLLWSMRQQTRADIRAAGFIWEDVPVQHRLLPDCDVIIHFEWPTGIRTFTSKAGDDWHDVTPKTRSPYPTLLPHDAVGIA
jgi:hypothetical protein